MRRLATGALLLAATLVAGCSDKSKSGTGPPPVTYSIAINAPDSTPVAGETSQLTATVTRSDGAPVTSPFVAWTSSDNNIATVDASGLLTAKAAGSVKVTATSNGASADAGIRVRPSPRDSAAKIVAESVYVGQTIDLRPYLLDNGFPPFTDSTTWTSSDPTVGTVDGGVFTPLKRGMSTVTATRNSKVGVVDVLAQTHVKALSLTPDTLVIPVGSSGAFDATATDSAGKRIYGRPVTWSVPDTAHVKVDGGVVAANFNGAPASGGLTTVTAVSEGAVAMAIVRLTAPPGYTISLTAPQSWVSVGKTVQINSATQDPWNFFLTNASLNWSSSDSSIARVSATGLVTGIARGKVTITAADAGHKGTITLNVEQPVASVVFIPDTVFLASHGSVALSPSLRDAGGNALTTRPLTWTSSDTNIVNLTGNPYTSGFLANGRGTAGRATVSGSVDGVVGVLNVNVTSGTDQMSFDRAFEGQGSYSFYDTFVRMYDATGALVSGRGVRLLSSDPGILSVQPDTATFTNGNVTLHMTTGHSGDVTVTATSGSLSANYLVHVAPVSVRVRMALKPTELAVGTPYRLTTNVALHVIDWTTSDASIATVSDSGLVTPLAGGIVRIVATARDALPPSADTATISIRAQQAPLVSSISATELQAGTSATITGQNFNTTPSANVVTIDGVPVQVTAATATQLNITLPATTSFPCQATHLAPLVVSTGPGLVTTSQQMLASAPQQSVAVGDADFWSPADSRCNEVVTRGGLYLLTVSNGGTSTSPWRTTT